MVRIANGSQMMLLFYKALLKLFVPITTDDPDDPNSLIYTFPNNMNHSVEYEGV